MFARWKHLVVRKNDFAYAVFLGVMALILAMGS